jgi:hypothetical protein
LINGLNSFFGDTEDVAKPSFDNNRVPLTRGTNAEKALEALVVHLQQFRCQTRDCTSLEVHEEQNVPTRFRAKIVA